MKIELDHRIQKRNSADPGFIRQKHRNTPVISVVIPAMNEARNLPHVLPLIPRWVDEVVLVDGNSQDDTVAVAQRLMPDIVIVGQDRPGKGAALMSGFRAARGEIIVMLDADGSTDPREIPAFVGALLSGADFVKGSRFLQGGGTLDMEWYRRLGNWGLVKLVSLRFGGNFSDLCYGYAAFWRDVLDRMSLDDAVGFEIETSMNVQALLSNLKITEVASTEQRRIHGKSNLRTIPDGWRVLTTIMRLSSRPQRELPGLDVAKSQQN
ncbi:glycosyltransferase family 2 protein [Pelagibacterium sp. 26DY04]|uniref:glycosyltransferase family 2 protein n=1 Tax=Pelagibacterium sp. 26DY04 TaxID=2967130 RepID=UPI002814E717|nr:glycosyltransferase family 2 protein [Pelagibacterium sp. 26DY04]WMT87940.1 glycosyltransferase family 2 protein [Pelagibacterium sp. 26DY04]